MDISQMDITGLRLLLYALVGLLAVTVVGLTFYLSRSARRVRRQREALVRGEFETALFDDEPQERPALRLVEDRTTGRLAVEVMGQRYHRLSEIEDDGLRRRVMLAAAEMVEFTGVLGDVEPKLMPPEEAVHWREDLRRAIPRSDADQTAAFLQAAARQAGQEELTPVTLASSLQRALRGTKPDSPEELSLVDEIDQIVQRRLSLTRGLQGRTLHLRRSDGEQIVFEFDGVEYSSIDDIPNHTARLLIQDSIREWEETR
jgi:hypothetical protein